MCRGCAAGCVEPEVRTQVREAEIAKAQAEAEAKERDVHFFFRSVLRAPVPFVEHIRNQSFLHLCFVENSE